MSYQPRFLLKKMILGIGINRSKMDNIFSPYRFRFICFNCKEQLHFYFNEELNRLEFCNVFDINFSDKNVNKYFYQKDMNQRLCNK